MRKSNIPAGFGPGIRADDTFPLFGLTQQWSGGPKARIFLPSDTADELGYYTRCIQYISDRAGGVHGVDFVWDWRYVAGHAYVPVTGAEAPPVTPPGTTPPPVGGMSPADVQSMIDASIAPLQAQIDSLSTQGGISFGSSIALRLNSGLFLGAVGGGPTAENQPAEFVGKPDAYALESFKVEPGQ
jgi:hypothetical protein